MDKDMGDPGSVTTVSSSASRGRPTERQPRDASTTAIGIMNPWGDMWTYETFPTVEAAEAHLHRFWRGQPRERLDGFKIVPVQLCVHALSHDDLRLSGVPSATGVDPSTATSEHQPFQETDHDR